MSLKGNFQQQNEVTQIYSLLNYLPLSYFIKIEFMSNLQQLGSLWWWNHMSNFLADF